MSVSRQITAAAVTNVSILKLVTSASVHQATASPTIVAPAKVSTLLHCLFHDDLTKVFFVQLSEINTETFFFTPPQDINKATFSVVLLLTVVVTI